MGLSGFRPSTAKVRIISSPKHIKTLPSSRHHKPENPIIDAFRKNEKEQFN